MKILFTIWCFALTTICLAQKAVIDSNTTHNKVAAKTYQYKNSIIICGADYYSPGTFRRFATLWFPGDQQVGIYYQRKVFHGIGIKIGYSQWNTFPWFKQALSGHSFAAAPQELNLAPGGIMRSRKYKMQDAFIEYSFDHFKKWKLNAELGISHTSGLDETIDSIYVNPDPPYDFILFQSEKKSKNFFGIVPAIGLDYICCKHKISLGADLRYRLYHDFYVRAIEYGFHIGYNF